MIILINFGVFFYFVVLFSVDVVAAISIHTTGAVLFSYCCINTSNFALDGSIKKMFLFGQVHELQKDTCAENVRQMFTSKMAADMPSETELLTRAKHLLTAAWSSCWLLSWARKTPAVLSRQRQGSVLRDSRLTGA